MFLPGMAKETVSERIDKAYKSGLEVNQGLVDQQALRIKELADKLNELTSDNLRLKRYTTMLETKLIQLPQPKVSPSQVVAAPTNRQFPPKPAEINTDNPPCPVCGCLTERAGKCHRCPNCGEQTGCS